MDEGDVTKEDYEIAVFTGIDENEYGKAFLWADKGITKFPGDDRLIAMRGWISQLRGDDDAAVKDLAAAMELNRRNPIALVRFGILYMGKNEYTLARSYLEAAMEADSSGTFGDDAKKALETLTEKEAVAGSGSSATGSKNP